MRKVLIIFFVFISYIAAGQITQYQSNGVVLTPVLDSIGQLQNFLPYHLAKVHVAGYYLAGDGGGGNFYWDDTATSTSVSGMIIQITGITTGRWKRIYPGGRINALWFGAHGDSVHDDTGPLISAINYSPNIIIDIPTPPKAYLVNGIIGINQPGVTINGSSKTGTRIVQINLGAYSTAKGIFFVGYNMHHITIQNLNLISQDTSVVGHAASAILVMLDTAFQFPGGSGRTDSNINILNNTINCTIGISLISKRTNYGGVIKNVLIQGNDFYNCTSAAGNFLGESFDTAFEYNITFRDNLLYHTGFYSIGLNNFGMSFSGYMTHILVDHNIFKLIGGLLCEFNGPSYSTISNNIIDSCTGTGVLTAYPWSVNSGGSSFMGVGNIVKDNMVQDSTAGAPYYINQTGLVVSGNKLYSFNPVNSGSSREYLITVQNSIFQNNVHAQNGATSAAAAIGLSTSTQNNQFINETFIGNITQPALFGFSDTVRNNVFSGCAYKNFGTLIQSTDGTSTNNITGGYVYNNSTANNQNVNLGTGIGTAQQFVGTASGGATSAGILAQSLSGNPGVGLYVQSGGTNDKLWDFVATPGNQMLGRLVNDANTSSTNWIAITRSGTTVSNLSFPEVINPNSVLLPNSGNVSSTLVQGGTNTALLSLDNTNYIDLGTSPLGIRVEDSTGHIYLPNTPGEVCTTCEVLGLDSPNGSRVVKLWTGGFIFNGTSAINQNFNLGTGTGTATQFVGTNTGGFTSAALLGESASGSAGMALYAAAAGANNKAWDFLATTGGQLIARLVNDANTAATNWLSITRSGTTVSSLQFPEVVSANGILLPNSDNISSTRVQGGTNTALLNLDNNGYINLGVSPVGEKIDSNGYVYMPNIPRPTSNNLVLMAADSSITNIRAVKVTIGTGLSLSGGVLTASTSANNGLTNNAGTIQLGGSLNQNTTINTTGSFQYIISNGSEYRVDLTANASDAGYDMFMRDSAGTNHYWVRIPKGTYLQPLLFGSSGPSWNASVPANSLLMNATSSAAAPTWTNAPNFGIGSITASNIVGAGTLGVSAGGLGGTATLVSGNDIAGVLQWVSSSLTAQSGSIIIANPGVNYISSNPSVIITAHNAAATALMPFIYSGGNGTSFSVFLNTITITSGTTYQFNYYIAQ